ncbi:MAG: hypothetical protein IPJ65_39510 [Archangiaceae bacterium]|nr:hypothetical protein [Archangiaceae bacterium]
MYLEPLIISLGPYSIRVAPGAIDHYQRLSEPEREWLYAHLERSSEDRLVWSEDVSFEAPYHLWVLHRWSDDTQLMDIIDLGYFPRGSPVLEPARRPQPARPSQPAQQRWDNEGGSQAQH